MSYGNPIVGGTVLRQPAISSPNFSQGPPLVGWSIQQNGNAFFGNVTASGTITASEFDGTDFVINQQGFFLYGGPPANGNLIFSVAPTNGTDEFGNPFINGFRAYQGSGSTNSAVLAQTVIAIINQANSSQQAGIGNDFPNSSGALATQPYFFGETSTGDLAVLVSYDVSAGVPNWAATGINALQPGTGQGVPETWHAMILGTNFSASGSPFATPRYRLETGGGGTVVRLSGAVTLTGNTGAFATIWTPPAGYIPVSDQHLPIAYKAAGGSLAPGTLASLNDNLELVATGATGDQFWLDGITYVLN